jgi:hypothetical protein
MGSDSIDLVKKNQWGQTPLILVKNEKHVPECFYRISTKLKAGLQNTSLYFALRAAVTNYFL